MLSNCFVWAHWQHLLMVCEWERAGQPSDWLPIIQRRPSWRFPRIVGHWTVFWQNPITREQRDIRGFTPLDPKDVPWWLIWTRVLFRGYVDHGDRPPKD